MTPIPQNQKPDIFVSLGQRYEDDSRRKAVIIDMNNRHVLGEVTASRSKTAEEVATSAVDEFRAEYGDYPAEGPNDDPTKFELFLASYVTRISLCDETYRMLPKESKPYYSDEAALFAANRGQLVTYLQAVTTLTALGKEGREAVDILNDKILLNKQREEVFIAQSPAGESMEGMMRLSVQQAMILSAAEAGIQKLPNDPQPALAPNASRGWKLAELISPWWAKNSGSLMASKNLNTEFLECPGITPADAYEAAEAICGLLSTQRAIHQAQPGVTLNDVAGYGEQWKALFVMSYLSTYKGGIIDASKQAAPLAATLRKLGAEEGPLEILAHATKENSSRHAAAAAQEEHVALPTPQPHAPLSRRVKLN
jgi:hypothetical protein